MKCTKFLELGAHHKGAIYKGEILLNGKLHKIMTILFLRQNGILIFKNI